MTSAGGGDGKHMNALILATQKFADLSDSTVALPSELVGGEVFHRASSVEEYLNKVKSFGSRNRTRTDTPFPSTDFKSVVSAISPYGQKVDGVVLGWLPFDRQSGYAPMC